MRKKKTLKIMTLLVAISVIVSLSFAYGTQALDMTERSGLEETDEGSTEEASEDPAKEPSEDPAEDPGKDTDEEPAEDTMEGSSEEPAEDPGEDAAGEADEPNGKEAFVDETGRLYILAENGELVDLEKFLSVGYETEYIMNDEPEITEDEDMFMLQAAAGTTQTYTVRCAERVDDLFLGGVEMKDYTAVSLYLAMGMKTILKESGTSSSGGKTRYAYCLQYTKAAPDVKSVFTYKSWKKNLAIVYAMDHGARYYKEVNTDTRYGVGKEAGNNDYAADYWITQEAIHILNGEYTLAQLKSAMKGNGTPVGGRGNRWNTEGTYLQNYGNKIYSKVQRLVNDANKAAAGTEGYVDGYEDSYYISLSKSVIVENVGFQCDWYWDAENNRYRTSEFTPTFTENGNWFNEHFDSLEITCNRDNIGIHNSSTGTVRKTYLYAKPAALIGLMKSSATLTTKGKAWGQWGTAVFDSTGTSAAGDELQDLAMIMYREDKGKATVQRTDEITGPAVPTLFIYKKSAEYADDPSIEEHLVGRSVFAVYGYSNETSSYSTLVRRLVDNNGENKEGDGIIKFSNLDLTKSDNGLFLVKEITAPAGFSTNYVTYSAKDQTDAQTLGGRLFKLSAAGGEIKWICTSLSDYRGEMSGNIFCDEPLPECLTVTKSIPADPAEIIWAHGDPTFQIRVVCTPQTGDPFTLYHTFVFTKEYVETCIRDGSVTQNGSGDVFVSLSCTFDGLPADTLCDISEIRVSRFTLEQIETADPEAVFESYDKEEADGKLCYCRHVKVHSYPEDRAIPVTFTNKKVNYKDLSHTASVINVIEKE